MTDLTLYVPDNDRTIARASAVVGAFPDYQTGDFTAPQEADGAARVVVDVEGDIYARGMDFEARLQHAAGRHVTRYPTVGRLCAPARTLHAVGRVRHDEVLQAWVIAELYDRDDLAAWIAPEDVPQIGGSRRLQERAVSIWLPHLPQGDVARIQLEAGRAGGGDIVPRLLELVHRGRVNHKPV